MPFVIATDDRSSMQGGSENPSGALVRWFFISQTKWTKDIGRAKRMDDEDAAMQMVLLKDALPKLKFLFMVVDLLPVSAEAAAMDPSEIDRLRKLAMEFKRQMADGYVFVELPSPHQPRIYKIGEKQCNCILCVSRLIALFPDLR